MLNVEGAEFSYSPGKKIFSNVGFKVDRGDVLCILGPNGSGKTTLLKCVDNLLKLSAGHILLDGKDIQSMTRRQIASRIGYLPQTHVSTFPFSVLDVAVMGRSSYMGLTSSPSEGDYGLAETNLKRLGISHLIDEPYTKISGGERQLALIAMVLTQRPDILVLDEPTSHLDFGNQVRILEILRMLARQGLSVIFTSHFPNHAFQLSCSVALMSEGTFLVTGKADEVVSEDNLRRIYGIDVKIAYIEEAGSKTCVPLQSVLDSTGTTHGRSRASSVRF
jgi:iron complex transport system ATP-binding protein